MQIGGRVLMLIGIVILAIGALFCIIGLSTKGWIGGASTIFCDGCPKSPGALSIISFILLIISIVALVVQMFDMLPGALQLIPICLLFVSTIFLLATVASAGKPRLGYSYDLMVVAHFCSYISLAVTAYWFGVTKGSSG